MNDNQIQTDENSNKWVTVDEAFVLCQQANLDRTKKTIRSWCRNDHVTSEKQSTLTGERWMLETSSLQVKIRSELEFQRNSEPVRTSADPSEPVRTTDKPVQTGSHDQTENTDLNDKNILKIAELEREVRSLEIDKAVRDRHVDFLSKQNKDGQENLLSQSRYIGHLETQVMQLGGKPNTDFLSPPTVKNHGTEVQSNPQQVHLDIHHGATVT